MARSKKVKFGFVVVDTRTGEYLSALSKRREPAREIAKRMYEEDSQRSIGVHTLEVYVPEGWKHGDSLEPYAEPRLIRLLVGL